MSERQKTVLLVEDVQEMREAMADTLQRKGYEALQAGDGEAALQILNDRLKTYGDARVSVIVSDWIMSGMDGIQLLSQVRGGAHRNIPFLLVSGAVSRDQLESAIRLDADSVLLKPFQGEDLIKKIDEAVLLREAKGIRSQLQRR